MTAETRGPRRVEFRIVGDVADEQELVDLCHRIRDAGIELVGLRRIPADTDDAG